MSNLLSPGDNPSNPSKTIQLETVQLETAPVKTAPVKTAPVKTAPLETAPLETVEAGLQDCWNHIGVMGDHSCPLLVEAIHCQNCGVYGAAGRSLLQRVAPPGYVEEWIQILADGPESPDSGESRTEYGGTQQNRAQLSRIQPSGTQPSRAMEKSSSLQSLILFRLGEECLACPVHLLQLVTTPTPIHRIPHRQNPAFLGLVNVRGELLLCVSLRVLLGIAPPHPEPGHGQPRWIVMGTTAQPWVVPVDEIYGIDRVAIHTLEEPPIVLGQETAAYSQGMIQWQGRRVNVLAGDRLLANLQVALT